MKSKYEIRSILGILARLVVLSAFGGVIISVLVLFVGGLILESCDSAHSFYKYKVQIESCTGRPDKVVEFVSRNPPSVHHSEYGSHRFFSGTGAEGIDNICSFTLISKQKVSEGWFFTE